jgi:hypothetical protein
MSSGFENKYSISAKLQEEKQASQVITELHEQEPATIFIKLKLIFHLCLH